MARAQCHPNAGEYPGEARMTALLAYIAKERRGVELEPGKH